MQKLSPTIVLLLTVVIVTPTLLHARTAEHSTFFEFIQQRRLINSELLEAQKENEQRLNELMETSIEERLAERLQEAGIDKENFNKPDLEPLTFGQIKSNKPSNAIATYLLPTNVGRNKWNEVIDATIEAGGNSIIFDVKDSRVYFDTTSPIAQELGLISRHAYELEPALAEAKAKGLYTIARFVALKDEGFTVARPDTLTTHPQTGARISPGWADPSNPVTQAYNMELVCDLARAGIDEINLDYIRYSTAYVGALNSLSLEEKSDRILSFIKKIKETINNCGSETKLGVSTFAIIGWAYEPNVRNLGQDLKKWVEYIDVFSPMAYQQTFSTGGGYYTGAAGQRSRPYWLVYKTLQGYKDFLGPEHSHKLRPWLQAYSVSAWDVRETMDATIDAGSCGFMFWNIGNNFQPVYSALNGFELPERCR
jgi:hypothetical protein